MKKLKLVLALIIIGMFNATNVNADSFFTQKIKQLQQKIYSDIEVMCLEDVENSELACLTGTAPKETLSFPENKENLLSSDCFAVADNGNSPELYRLDCETGAPTYIGPLTISQDVEAIELGTDFITLYGIASQGGSSNPPEFGSINTTTGAWTQIGLIGSTTGPTAITPAEMDAITHDEFGNFWTISNDPIAAVLLKIDPVTGNLVSNAFGAGIDYIQLTGVAAGAEIEDMAYDITTQKFYIVTANVGGTPNSKLLELDVTTGATTTVVDFVQCNNDIEGLSITTDGQLKGSSGNGTGPGGNDPSCMDRFYELEFDGTITELSTISTTHTDFEAMTCPGAAYVCDLITASIFAIQPSCVDNVVQSDGYLQLSSVEYGDRINYSLGSTYTGDTNYANATTIGTLPFQFNTGLGNPSGSQDYTIRVFFSESNCFTDITVTMEEQDCVMGCDCTDFLYVNDPSFDLTHKFELNADGTVGNEIMNGTDPWLASGVITNAHGVVSDPNGNLFITQIDTDPTSLYKVTCDGSIISSDFFPDWQRTLNLATDGSTLFSIGRPPGGGDYKIWSHDLCSNVALDSIAIPAAPSGTTSAWGLSLGEDGNLYFSQSFASGNDHCVYRVDHALTTITQMFCLPEVANHKTLGIDQDACGNFYVITNDNASSTIYKVAPNGTVIDSIQDNTLNGSGFGGGWGMIYSAAVDKLYIGTLGDDCVAVVDAGGCSGNLTYEGASGVPHEPGSYSKSVYIVPECCPTNNHIVIDTTVCNQIQPLFLRDLIGCSEAICESGSWVAGAGNVGLTFDPCTELVTTGAEGCGSFTLESDGLGPNNRCGAFKITVNITVAAMEITVNQTNCIDNGDNTFTASYDVEVDWESVPCVAGETIDVTHNGTTIGTINSTTGSSPSTFSVNVNADGLGNQIFAASFSSDVCPADSVIIVTPSPCPADVAPCTSSTGCMGGNAFEDFNCNGADETNEPGVQGVQVEIYDCNNNLIGTTYTDGDGDWQICGLTDGDNYRVEFILPENIADWANPTHSGSDNGTDVQFLTAPACTKFSLSSPGDYCQNNPFVYVSCYVNGESGANGTADDGDSFVSFRYESNGENGSGGYTGAPNHLSHFDTTGATWGIGFDRINQRIFTSSVYRRHSGFGPLGTGGIYMLDANSPTPVFSNYIDLTTLGITTGADTRTAFNGLPLSFNELPSDTNINSWDVDAFDKIGRSSLGDIEISDDGKTLYVVNIENTSIVTLDISGATPTLISEVTVPAPVGCPSSDFYIWGLALEKGDLYIGGVCSAEYTNNVNDLNGFVIKHDGTTFQTIATIPFDYARRDNATGNGGGNSDWKPWTSTYQTQAGGSFAVWPQPIISDIEFDEYGSIILGVMDRNGMQVGSQNYTTAYPSTSIIQGISSGDVLKICNGVLESNGTCGGITTLGANDLDGYSDGTNNGEFYWGDQYDYNAFTNPITSFATHTEIGFGSLLLLKGLEETMMTVYNPTQTANSGGVILLDNNDGGRNSYYGSASSGSDFGYRLYEGASGDPSSFAKSNGLGDLEAGCDPAPLEIGNYVWCDSIENGIQDACEVGVNDLVVQLYDAAGALVGQDTTVNGNYYFNQYNIDTTGITIDGSGVATPNTEWTGMSYETKYYVVFGNGQFDSGVFTIGTETFNGITTVDVNSNANDNVDSDVDGNNLSIALGAMPTGLPAICITTETTGCGNHRYDMGIICEPCPEICLPVNINVNRG